MSTAITPDNSLATLPITILFWGWATCILPLCSLAQKKVVKLPLWSASGRAFFTGTLIIRFGAMRIAAAGLLITACPVLYALCRESFL
ncbi:hypothetical protein NFJ01_08500 [Lelliottia amnigena]|uniref:hypothetical protein n=1 Tax=Lelliottia amnigena TaxID=61646 RepID=UPI0020908F5D|nr:hypothetical protein [Lelliottia amnigena]USR62392.1 hypothetical protein NFJ01_08500 [Lelliottia amnigena]